MIKVIRWTRAHKFEVHLLAFLLIALPAVLMYNAAEMKAVTWIWILIVVVIVGNMIALAVDG